GPGTAHQLARRGDRRQREPARQALGGDEDVRAYAGVLVPPEPAGAAEPGLDLVEDEQDAVPVRALAQPGEETGRGGYVAALAEDRLDHERGGLPCRADGRQHIVELA